MAELRLEDVIRRPLITEKNTRLMEQRPVLVRGRARQPTRFRSRRSRRDDLQGQGQSRQHAECEAERSDHAVGQPPRWSHRWSRPGWKKAIVTLQPGRPDRSLRAGLSAEHERET